MAAQPEMRFVYRNGAGEVSERMLLNWAEIGHYIKGHCTTKGSVLTFRKDRVSEYLNGSDALLGTPRCSPPPRPVRGGPVDARPRSISQASPQQHAMPCRAKPTQLAYRSCRPWQTASLSSFVAPVLVRSRSRRPEPEGLL